MTDKETAAYMDILANLAPYSPIIEMAIKAEFTRLHEDTMNQYYALRRVAGHTDVPIDYYDDEYIKMNVPPGRLQDEILGVKRRLEELRNLDMAAWDACRHLRRFPIKPDKTEEE